MKSSNSLVTVIITARNAEDYIRKALDSVLSQTYSNLEIIVIDDASADSTPEILKEYKKKSKNFKIVFLNKSVGPTLAANPGLTMVSGKYIARLDADDICFSDRIEKQVDFLEKHPEVIVVGGQCVLIDKNGEVAGKKKFPINHNEIHEVMFYRNPIQHPSCMINKSLVPKKVLRYDDHFRMADDLEFYFKLAQFGKLANLKDEILYYRQSFSSHSLKNIKKTFLHTLGARLYAVLKYGYRPTLKGLFCNFCQMIIVPFLPGKIVFALFSYLVGMKKLILSGFIPAFGMVSARD